MASTIKQQIEASLNKQVEKRLSPDRLVTAYRAGAAAVLDDIRRTARSGVSTSGTKMPSYSERYRKMKGRYISTGKFGKRTLKRTGMAATSVEDKTVLTGRLHQDMQVSSVKAKQDAQGFISGSFSFGFKSKRSQDIDGYLMEKGYHYRWVSASGTAAGRRQRKLFIQELQKTLGFRGGAVGLSEA